MNRYCSFDRLSRLAVFFSVCFLVPFAQVGRASDAHQYFKNYFVTGDYVVAGVGLRGTGASSGPLAGFATGTINMSGVPCTSAVTPGPDGKPLPVGPVPCFNMDGTPAMGAV